MVKFRRNLFNFKNSKHVVSKKTITKSLTDTITAEQLTALNDIFNSYTSLLANKSFESIPNNYTKYIKILTQLKSIQIADPNLQLFIQIAENSLTGSMNVGAIYTSYAYNEIKVALLNKRIREILSEKNTQHTADNVSGQFTATQTFTMAPIFSYYVYLYGLPDFGVGFDPAKMAFLQSLPQFIVQGKPDNEKIKSDFTVVPAGTR